MFRVKRVVDKLLSWCPLCAAMAGGWRYWRRLQEHRYRHTQFLQCGVDVELGEGLIVRFPDRLIIGDHVFVGRGCFLNAMGGLRIGRYCALAAQSVILTTNHDFRSAESIPWGDARVLKPVDIEDYVWIGMNAAILPGVRVGEGAVVGLGAVVARDVPPRAIVVGNPAEVVGYREAPEFDRLKASGAWRSPTRRCDQYVIPPAMWQKHATLLSLQPFAAKSVTEDGGPRGRTAVAPPD